MDTKFGDNIAITPVGYEIKLKNGSTLKTEHAFIGMSSVIDGVPLYGEAANDAGLGMAGLNFPGNASLNKMAAGKLNLAVFELIPYFLGKYKSVDEVISDLENLNIIDTPFKEGMPTGEMHYMISDAKRSIVVEQTLDGLHIYDNKLDVMTNNPPFDYHLMNINNYMNLSAKATSSEFRDRLDLKTYGEGMGAIGLPGDNSPASRLVRATFNLANSVSNVDEESSVNQFFHILDSVSMTRGSVISKSGKYDITYYACSINLSTGTYYYKTYENSQINAVRMTDEAKYAKDITLFKVIDKGNFNYQN